MAQQRGSRGKRKERQQARAAAREAQHDEMMRGYARQRERDEAARAALVPLEPGERPTAVTVGAIVASLMALANLVALIVSYDPKYGSRNGASLLGLVILVACAGGMWRARYWAVLGMQTLLALLIVAASISLIGAQNWQAFVLLPCIIVPAGALFWFLVKAMARIQMPDRPGR